MATEKRLIDANELENILNDKECIWFGNSAYFPRWLIGACIASCHTGDAVEVVRCKDCRFYQEDHWCARVALGIMYENDFCSYGERKGTK